MKLKLIILWLLVFRILNAWILHKFLSCAVACACASAETWLAVVLAVTNALIRVIAVTWTNSCLFATATW